MRNEYSVIIERDAEGYYVASVPSLRGCHTQGKSLDEVIDRIREAIELCVQTHGADSDALEFVGIQKITVRT